MTRLNVLSKLKIPVVAFSVGAQAPSARRLQLPRKSIDFWKSIADHSASLGVRGTYSAEVLNDIGIKNVDIIGCPSLFRHNDPFLRARVKPLQAIVKVAFNLRREVSGTYTSDAARYLGVQKAAIRSLAANSTSRSRPMASRRRRHSFSSIPNCPRSIAMSCSAKGGSTGRTTP